MSQSPDLKTWGIAVAVFLFALFLAFDRATPTFWSADNGVKWWQAKTISEKGLSETFLEYPLSEIDPDGKYQPLGWKFGRMEGDRVRFTYPPFFAALLSLNLDETEFRKSLLWAAIALGALVPLFTLVAKKFGLSHPNLFAAFLTLGTPLIVYGIEANEHLIALFFGLLGWVLLNPLRDSLSPSKVLLAGVSIGLAAWLREEYWLWGAACSAPLLVAREWKRWIVFSLAIAGMFGMSLVLQSWLTPETQVLRGVHIHEDIPQTSFGLYYFRYRWALLNHWLFSSGHYDEANELSFANPLPWILFAVVCTVVFVRRRTLGIKSNNSLRWEPLAGIVFLWGLLSLFFTVQNLRVGVPHIGGLLPAFPLVGIALLAVLLPTPLSSKRNLEAFLTIVLFAIALWILAGSSRGGRQWGPRYFMIAWPFLAVWAWAVLEWLVNKRGWVGAVAIAPLIGAQLLTAGFALDQVRDQQGSLPLEALQEFHIEEPSRVFLTDLEYLPAAAVGVGHDNWAVFPNHTPRDSAESFVQEILTRNRSVLWIGRGSGADWGLDSRLISGTQHSRGLQIELFNSD